VTDGRYAWTSPGLLSIVLRVLLLATGVGTLLLGVAGAAILSRDPLILEVPAPGVVPTWADGWWWRVGWIPSIVSQATLVVWLVWQHHATANLWARGVPNLRVTPGWAVGWWFVPFANLVMPYRAMRELERRSTRSGQSRSSGPLLPWWWVAWLAQSLLPPIAIGAALWPRWEAWVRSVERDPETIDVTPIANAAAPWLAVAGVLSLLAAVLAFRVVGRIDEAQRWMEQGEVTPPRPDLPVR
jgi:hypothetical protein